MSVDVSWQQMSESLQVTGGAQVAWVNLSWPFARLSASATELSIKSWLLGSYSFSPDQVAVLKPYGSIPILASGIQVIHTNSSYPGNIVFWSFGSPRRLIERIQGLGFRPRASLTSVPRRDGIAVRWSFIIGLIVVWNALFLLDGFLPWEPKPHAPGIPVLLAIGLLFLTATALSRSTQLQSLVLKPGRCLSEVRPMVLLIQLVSAFLLIGFVAQHVAS